MKSSVRGAHRWWRGRSRWAAWACRCGHFADGRLTPEAFRAAQVAAGAELEEALEDFRAAALAARLRLLGHGRSGFAGAGGLRRWADGTVTPKGLRWCIDQCLKAGRVEALDLPGLKDDRRPVIGGGLSLLYTLAIQFGLDALVPARGALRQGVIFDLDRGCARGTRQRPCARRA